MVDVSLQPNMLRIILEPDKVSRAQGSVVKLKEKAS